MSTNGQMSKDIFSPSQVWHHWLDHISFLTDVNPRYLRFLVGFGYYLGSPIEKDLWRVNRYREGSKEEKISEDFERIIGDDCKFLLNEHDPKREDFSVPYQRNGITHWLNTDVIRMQVDMSNIERFGLADFNNICEIGGGYGQLALGFLMNNPKVKYTIIDFPQILSVVEIWMRHLSKGILVKNYDNIESYLDESSAPGLHLLPNNLLAETDCILQFDLGLNINSFCEMSAEQIEFYFSRLKFQNFYSNNRDRKPNNHEIDDLTAILLKNSKLYPKPCSYASGNYKKRVYVLGDMNKVNKIKIDKIKGVTGASMPGLTDI